MSQNLICDICNTPIEDNKYYVCESCNKAFHHDCAYKERNLFKGQPGLRRCKFCQSFMIDKANVLGYVKKVKEEMKKEEEIRITEELKKIEQEQIEENVESRVLEEEEEDKNSNILDREYDRAKIGGLLEAVKKKAQKSMQSGMGGILDIKDYKDTWTLIHGRIPILGEDYLFFNQIDEALNQHPNFLHFQIKEFLEKLGYIIEHDIKPLPVEFRIGTNVCVIFNFTGYLSAEIECKKDKIKGFTKIYLKEEGICHYSKEFEPPFVKGNIHLVFAGNVENMSIDELGEDITKLKEKIIEFLQTKLPF
ncbi:MAG: hypothetical protein ACFFCM_02450 [Promethearchaeota archaeon]